MKINFKRVWAKNFRSVDNAGLELLFKPGATMVGSIDNGAGKSTLIVWAAFYALFDKPYGKGTSKTQLINSRSNKESVVEIEFNANGYDWLVRRGQKPTLFQIFKDGVEIKDEAALKHHQMNLDKAIGMDEKAFCNTVALGLDKFIPFVSMPASDRRNYGEQMLDLVVISRMNEANKVELKQMQSTQGRLDVESRSLDFKIKSIRERIELKQRHAKEIQDDLDSQIDEYKATLSAQIASRDDKAKEKETLHLAVTAAQLTLTNLNRALELKKGLEEKITQCVEELSSIKDAACKSCGQPLPADKIEARKQEIKKKALEVREGILKTNTLISGFPKDAKALYENHIEEYTTKGEEIAAVQAGITFSRGALQQLLVKKDAAAKGNDWAGDTVELEGAEVALKSLLTEYAAVGVKIRSAEVLAAALRDDGVKAKIVDQYLPFINERVNEYMNKMNLFINIEITNEFEITMNAPDRRGQTINSLSTGQQRRVDLAILLAWRDVAKAAAACDSNVLVLDEILENLSSQGVEEFLEMWNQIDSSPDTCLYVITQRVLEFEPLFDQSIIYELRDDSTVIHKES